MENFFKLKKSKIFIFLFLFFNQFLFNGFALNHKKIDLRESKNNNLSRKHSTTFNNLLAEKNKTSTINQEANRIEEFLEEIYDANDFESFKNQVNKEPLINNVDQSEKLSTSKDNENKKSNIE